MARSWVGCSRESDSEESHKSIIGFGSRGVTVEKTSHKIRIP